LLGEVLNRRADQPGLGRVMAGLASAGVEHAGAGVDQGDLGGGGTVGGQEVTGSAGHLGNPQPGPKQLGQGMRW
jgi:hypothetical protein